MFTHTSIDSVANYSTLEELIALNDWLNVPKEIITREGHSVDASTDTWNLPYSIHDASINFSKILESTIRWVTKRCVQEKLEHTSTHAGYTCYQSTWSLLLRHQNEYGIVEGIGRDALKEKIIILLENQISSARSDHKLWMMYRPIQWYIWCAENYPEIGFCPTYATELSAISIPGNPKGEAVRMQDPECGPLHRLLELPLLIEALRSDSSLVFEHLQQKAAVALSLAFGRNPANLTFLKEQDLVNLTPELAESCWIVRMPRIKKRLLSPRDDFLEEYLNPEFARYLVSLIKANKSIETKIETDEGFIEVEKPLFINLNKNKSAIAARLFDEAYNMSSDSISHLLRNFVRRHNIISPLTGKLLHISARRFRYTLGTNLAAEGISRRELARVLDHSDTQHVHVYFELAGDIVEHLDKATAKKFTKYLSLFKGKIVNSHSDAINGGRNDKHLSFFNESNSAIETEIGVCGENSICYLDPPFSCYLCPKFQPYKYADHEYVLDCLIKNREIRLESYENSRIGVQLDEVIIAVAQVIEQCRLVLEHE